MVKRWRRGGVIGVLVGGGASAHGLGGWGEGREKSADGEGGRVEGGRGEGVRPGRRGVLWEGG